MWFREVKGNGSAVTMTYLSGTKSVTASGFMQILAGKAIVH